MMQRLLNERQRTIAIMVIVSAVFLLILMSGLLIDTEKITIDLEMKSLAPSINHLFGTDWLGRDMLMRTLKGLTLSFGVGILAALLSTLIALLLSLFSTWNKTTDYIVTWLIDIICCFIPGRKQAE